MVTPLLLVFLAVADADREPARAMIETAVQSFGGDVRVAVEYFEGAPPTLAALAAAARARRATAAARVLWSDAVGSQVSIDVYLPQKDLRVHRGLIFQPQDRPAERGRAIGLVIAALALGPDEPTASASGDRARPVSPPPSRAPDSHPAAVTSSRPPDAATEEAQEPPETSERPEREIGAPPASPSSSLSSSASAPPAAPALGPWAVEAVAAAGVAVGGAGGGVGGGVGVRRLIRPRWGTRVAVQARSGSVPEAQASSFIGGVAAGVFGTLRPVTTGQSGLDTPAATPPWNAGARLDLIAGYEMLTHFSSDDPEPVRRGRILPAVAAWAEVAWRIAPAAMLHAGTGAEVAFGGTRVLVRGIEVAELAPVRFLGELGIRVRF